MIYLVGITAYDVRGNEVETVYVDNEADIETELNRLNAVKAQWLVDDALSNREKVMGDVFFGFGVIPQEILEEYRPEEITIKPPLYEC